MDDFVLMEDKFASRMTKSKGTQPSPPISQSTGITPTRSPPAEKSEEEIAEEVGVIAKKRDQLLSSLRRAQLAKGIRDQDDEEHQDPSTSTIEQLDHIQAVHQMLQEIQDALKNAPQDVLSFVNPLKEKVNKSIDHLEQYEQVARRARGDSIKRTLIEKQLRSIEELVQQDQEDAKWMKHLDSIVRIQRYYRRWQTRRKLAHISKLSQNSFALSQNLTM